MSVRWVDRVGSLGHFVEAGALVGYANKGWACSAKYLAQFLAQFLAQGTGFRHWRGMIGKFLKETSFRVFWALRRRLAVGEKRKHIIFRFSEAFVTPAIRTTRLEIQLLKDAAQLEAIEGLSEFCRIRQAQLELTGGAVAAVAQLDGVPAAIAFFRRVDPWYVCLGPEDAVIYSVSTARTAMGKGLAGALVTSIAEGIVARGGTAYLDCALWNTRAHRAFEKAGFVRIKRSPVDAIPNGIGDA